MRPLPGIALALLAGCAPCPTFDEITVEGGDRFSRAVVRDALDQFALWTGREGVCVDTVRLVDDLRSGEHASLGGYRSMRRLIELRRRQPHLADTLVHELCHAVDHLDGVVKQHRGVFRYDPAAHDYDRRSRRSREQEAMALTCEAGPEALAVAASVGAACAPQVDLAAVHAVLATVYPEAPEQLEPIALSQREVGSLILPDGWTLSGSHPVAAGPDGELVFFLRSGPSWATLVVDAWTGAPVDSPTQVVPAAQPPPQPTYLWDDVRSAGFRGPSARSDGWSSGVREGRRGMSEPAEPDEVGSTAASAEPKPRPATGFDDGTRVVAFSWRLASGQVLHPLIVHDGEGWRLPDDPCGSPTTWLVEVEGAPWVVQREGAIVTWSELSR